MRRWTRKRKLAIVLGLAAVIYVGAYASMVVPLGSQTTIAFVGQPRRVTRSTYPGYGFPIPMPEDFDHMAAQPALTRFFAPIHWLDRRLRTAAWDPANVRWPDEPPVSNLGPALDPNGKPIELPLPLSN